MSVHIHEEMHGFAETESETHFGALVASDDVEKQEPKIWSPNSNAWLRKPEAYR